jgi:hypothetical protein
MIEYLHNAIRMVAGQDTPIYAFFGNDDGTFVSEDCWLMLHNPDGSMLAAVEGSYNEESGQWTFDLPASLTTGLSGRYWYCFQHDNANLCFKQPLYLLA